MCNKGCESYVGVWEVIHPRLTVGPASRKTVAVNQVIRRHILQGTMDTVTINFKVNVHQAGSDFVLRFVRHSTHWNMWSGEGLALKVEDEPAS